MKCAFGWIAGIVIVSAAVVIAMVLATLAMIVDWFEGMEREER